MGTYNKLKDRKTQYSKDANLLQDEYISLYKAYQNPCKISYVHKHAYSTNHTKS